MPDGTNLGGVTSNLFSAFNARFGSAAAWQNQILKAAQVWAQQTNLNFAVVSDNGALVLALTGLLGSHQLTQAEGDARWRRQQHLPSRDHAGAVTATAP
jgi:hypothetical protein